MTTVQALKDLYVALGGAAADVADCNTNVDVLNVISAKYEGADNAVLNPEAIANITAVAGNIGGGGESDFSTAQITFYTQSINALPVSMPMAIDIDEEGLAFATVMRYPFDGDTWACILYKGLSEIGHATGEAQLDMSKFEVTGDITKDTEENVLLVRGDGTITYTP